MIHPAVSGRFVEQVRGEGAPWFEITTPPGAAPLAGSLTDDRYIIKYIEPLSANRSAHGLDIGSHPVRREAAERALLVNDASLTGTIQLVQDDQQFAGFLYLLPHYRPGMPLNTLKQRAEALLGWVYMPMLGPKVFEGIALTTDGELDIDVFGRRSLEPGHADLRRGRRVPPRQNRPDQRTIKTARFIPPGRSRSAGGPGRCRSARQTRSGTTHAPGFGLKPSAALR